MHGQDSQDRYRRTPMADAVIPLSPEVVQPSVVNGRLTGDSMPGDVPPAS